MLERNLQKYKEYNLLKYLVLKNYYIIYFTVFFIIVLLYLSIQMYLQIYLVIL